MKTKHVFVPALDAGEIIPFTVKKIENVQDSIRLQEVAKEKLVEFINKLEKEFHEGIYYLGFDEIGGKFYERFMFEKGGFLEIMVEAPVAINAHFIEEEKAKKFCIALKKTLKGMLPKNKVSEMFTNSIDVETDNQDSLTYKKWETIKGIRD